MTKIIIDGKEYDLDPNLTLLQACEAAGKEIPRFCFHERLSIAGNCRMCLVEVRMGGRPGPKPVASCAQQLRDLPPVKEGQPLHEIVTGSPTVKKAREGVMEFLLINHPLDCPICDQGGECDLQDQAMAYGHDKLERFKENKRAVTEKNMGPLVKTIMTRCIHCTRCVRFAAEVAGVDEIGAIGRGEDMEITTYLEKAVTSELSGNIIDLCPVGALTSKPYAFNARPWELKKIESIDVMDALGANIRIDARGREVMRILPRNNDDVNEEWISDKTRFVWDGLKRQRLDRPYVRKDGKLTEADWPEAFAAIAARFATTKPERMAAIVGDLADAESIKALKDLMTALGVVNLDCRQDGAKIGLAPDGTRGPRAGYLFNSGIASVEAADALLLIGTNPRMEAPVLNARIRKAWLRGNLNIARLGPPADLNYPVCELGNNPADLIAIADGRHAAFETLKSAKHPMLIIGMGALARPDGAAVLAACAKIASATGMIGPEGEAGWNGFNLLHTAAARVAALDLGFLPGQGGRDTAGIVAGAGKGEIDTLFLLGADEIDTRALGKAFVIYLGSHGDKGAHRADIILPGAAYTEKPGTYVNIEGRVQRANRASFPPGEAKEDWTILRALSEVLGRKLPYDSLAQLREAMASDAPHVAQLDKAPGFPPADPAIWRAIGTAGPIDNAHPFVYPISDFYLTNPIARASATLAECSRSSAGRPLASAAE
ncbi:MAG: NADH-quinone oxidoreductase subunit G [Alphaproteobacteria bacterium]|nr:NADH-quinone oxidoreductase subunit G [Alphaproteobacteria bacterium]